jgi:uncharacterized protein YbjT (DUF2867 family)
MKILVIGADGVIGSKLIRKLRECGEEAIPASANIRTDVPQGSSLPAKLAEASVVVDVRNFPVLDEPEALWIAGTPARNLFTDERASGIEHHLVLSVVGAGGLPDSGYFRGWDAKEKVVRTAAIPYTIVRATQPFECLKRIADHATVGTAVRLPPVLIQPIAADDIVRALRAAVLGPAHNGVTEIAGPQYHRLDAIVRRELRRSSDPRPVIVDRCARYFGAEVGEHTLLPDDDARLYGETYDDWVNGIRSSILATRPAQWV